MACYVRLYRTKPIARDDTYNYAAIKEGWISAILLCCGQLKMKFSRINHGYFRPKKGTEMRRICSIIVWDLENKGHGYLKAVQCLTTSDGKASRRYMYQIQISKSIYSTHISFRHRYKLKKINGRNKPNLDRSSIGHLKFKTRSRSTGPSSI